MFKRKKDGGFTLIELMIVIAVIGILAVVLVPKMTGVKDSAKEAGVVTNAKSVEAFAVANVDRWASTNPTTTISNHFTADGDDQLKNPVTGESGAGALSVSTTETTDPIAGDDDYAGSVTVQIIDSDSDADKFELDKIEITAWDASGLNKLYTGEVKPYK